MAQAVGLLFGRDPDRFAGAVANVLRQANPPAASPALWAVRRTGHRIPIVEEALLERVSMMDDGRVSDPQVLEVAAAIIPEKLLSRGWEKLEQWIPQARAALAVTLASIGHLEEALAERRFELLVRLAGDGLHAVRRAAYRSLARCEEVRFAALLASWAVAHFRGGEAVRRRASEGCGWLPEAPVEGPLAALAWDPEESVRESFVQASAERDERRLAKMYGTSVLAVAKPEDVFRLWRYGAALGQVGDDHSVELLERKLGNDLAPSVRFWLKRVKTAVKRRWDKVTQAWPEPWFTRRGVTVPLRGVIKAPNGREIEVHGYIWRTTPEPPERLYTWGGWVVGGRLDVGENQLLLPGRRPVPILVTTLQFPSGPAVFSGAAEYPDA